MKKFIVALIVLVVIAAAGVVFFIGSPHGPKLSDVASLKEPHLTSYPAQRVIQVTAKGNPSVMGKNAFGLLMKTYFKLKGVPKYGPSFKPPRARWPFGLETPVNEWVGLYAMPVPDSVRAIDAATVPQGMKVELTEWNYGEVAEILHVGGYDEESPTIARLKSFISDKGYEIAGNHEEEYLKGPGMLFSGDPKNYLTIIRYQVRKVAEKK
jgi:hypothetical protein